MMEKEIDPSSRMRWNDSTPALLGEEGLDSLADLVTNLADPGDRFALRILEGPIVPFHARHDRTLITASHRDQCLRLLRQL